MLRRKYHILLSFSYLLYILFHLFCCYSIKYTSFLQSDNCIVHCSDFVDWGKVSSKTCWSHWPSQFQHMQDACYYVNMKDQAAFACSSKLCISAVTAMMIDSGTKSAPFIGMATWLTYCNSDEGSFNRLKDES